MNERLVEDWLTKANERSYQTPFAQSLLADGMEVLRVAHSPHEHGKDVIAIDRTKKIHAFQLKDGDFDLKDFERQFGQITALVETPVEHPAITGHPKHQPWLVVSGQTSIPVEDRIRVHNVQWKKRGFPTLKLIVGRQLLAKFSKMVENFWPQTPEDSHRLFTLYLTDGKGNLDREAIAKLIGSIVIIGKKSKMADVARRLSAANLFTSHALSPFYRAKNYYEIIQGWTITAARIAWAAEEANISTKIWRPTFRLAVDAALTALEALVDETMQPNALRPGTFMEMDEVSRSRCSICAGLIALKILIVHSKGGEWSREKAAKKLLEDLFTQKRLVIWGESSIPFFLAMLWALDNLRGDQFSDNILFAALAAIVQRNSGFRAPKLPLPYDSADEANAKLFRRHFKGETGMDMQGAFSYTLESLVTIAARRMWRNHLAMFWAQITKIDLVRLVPDKPRDLLLWHWGTEKGLNQERKFSSPKSWRELLTESRQEENNLLPSVIKEEFEFALLFMVCFPHRMSRPLVKYFEDRMRSL